jgi:hypothetical protein
MLKSFSVGIIANFLYQLVSRGGMAMKFELETAEAFPDSGSDETAKVLLARFGLLPRKRDSAAQMNRLLLELYERKKTANRMKKPEEAVVTVEEMGLFAGIKRQTMYDYLGRWLALNLLKKTSFVANGKVVIGYELNGPNLEAAFRKAEFVIKNHVEHSISLVKDLQNQVKKEKIKQNMPQNSESGPEPPVPEPAPPEPAPNPDVPQEEAEKTEKNEES